MSHVISAQPSATSPYQPTAMAEGNGGDNPPRIHRIDSEQNDDCCIHTRNKKGCCLFVCTLLSMCCQGIKNCTETCCDCCANCLNDCCEDKPRKRNQRIYNNRYKNSGGSYYDNDDNDDWGITSLSPQLMHVGVSSHHSEPAQDLMANSNDAYNSSTRHDSGTHHSSGHEDSGTHHSSGHHDSSTHHSSSHHDSGTHHTSSHHDSGTHHTSSHHESGTHHTSSHDTSTCHDSGGGFDSGGGCDSGGGGGGGDD